MNDRPGFARAQRMYDNMTPPDDGPYECPDCGGTGTDEEVIGDRDDTCQCCGGTGWLDENGEPCKSPDDQYAEACEAADRKRDEMLTREPQTDQGDIE